MGCLRHLIKLGNLNHSIHLSIQKGNKIKLSYTIGLLSLVATLLLAPNSSSAAEKAVAILPNPLTADDIIVSGNKKSKTSFIKKLIIRCSEEDESPDYIKKCLERTRYFRDIKVAINSQNKLDVQLRDGISLLGFPVIASNDEASGLDSSIGVALFDTNSAGRGNFMLLFYRYLTPSQRSSFNFIYGFNNLGATQDDSVSIRLASQAIINRQFLGEDWVYGAEEQSSSVGLSFSRPFSPATLRWSVDYTSAEFGENFRVDDPENARNAREENLLTDELVSFGKTSLGFDYSLESGEQGDYYFAGYTFNQGLDADLYAFTDNDKFEGDTPPANDLKLATNFYLGVPSVKSQVFQLNLKHAVRQRDNAYGSYKIGAQLGTRGIPNSGLWSKEYTTMSLEYQVPILQRRSVIWTFSPFIDIGYAHGIPTDTNQLVDLESSVNWIGRGLATYLYFRRVPVPAVGVSFGANDKFFTGGTVNVIIGQNF